MTIKLFGFPYVPFRIHYRNNLIDKKDSYPIPRPPSWDDHNCSYGHQLYHSEHIAIHNCIKYIDILFSAVYERENPILINR
jgi:hypothetical protein